jgi:hypothetical protein
MKRLYKIIILFAVIFLIGMYFSFKSINEAFSDDTKVEVVSMKPSTSKNYFEF